MKALLLLLLLSGPVAWGQSAPPCSCRRNFDRMVELITANYAGYSHKVTPATRPRLDSLTAALRTRSDRSTYSACQGVLTDWLNFFKDGHLQVATDLDARREPEKVRALFSDWERVPLDEPQFRAYLDNPNTTKLPLEGIWRNEDGSYRLGLIRGAEADRLNAFVLEADSVWWLPGQVKARLKARPDGTFQTDYFMRDHSPNPVVAKPVGDGLLDLFGTWHRLYPNPVPPPARAVQASGTSPDGYRFTMLDDTTALYRIPSFDGAFKPLIDSLTAAHAADLRRTKLLLLDLRNNGGGSDQSFESLTPYLYTNPVRIVGLEHYATLENVKKYDQYAKLIKGLDDKELQYFDRLKKKQLKRLGKFVTLGNRQVFTERHRRVLPNPSRVAILINRGCGSTTEQLLLAARQSRKVTLFGENTAGVLDYANMYFTDLPCYSMSLGWATSRSLRIRRGEGIDNVGIPPQVRVPEAEKDWVSFVRNYYAGRL